MIVTYSYFCFVREFFEAHWLIYASRQLFLKEKKYYCFLKTDGKLQYLHRNIIKNIHQDFICPIYIKNYRHIIGAHNKKVKAAEIFWNKTSLTRLVSYQVTFGLIKAVTQPFKSCSKRYCKSNSSIQKKTASGKRE